MRRSTTTSSGARQALIVLAAVAFALTLLVQPSRASAASVGAAGQPQAAQGQPAPEGFEPVTGVPSQEQLPAAPLIMMAYAFVWVMLLLYLWTLWRRLGAVEKELADVTRRVGEGRRS